MRLPMFPLGVVVLPGQLTPLRVFEPRFRQLAVDAITDKLPLDTSGRPQFGMILIARGSEVGGGDTRTSTGTLTTLRSIAPGRDCLNIVGGGVQRIAVMEWLADDPYPVADAEPWPDAPPPPELVDDLAARRVALVESATSLRQLAAELQPRRTPTRAPAAPRIGNDLVLAGYQLAAAAPLGAADRQAVLEAPSVATRFDILEAAFADLDAALRFRLA